MIGPRSALLFLSHRIPYPPDKGDKIRSYHLLAGLAERYRIFLGAYVDDDADWAHRSTLEGLCEEVQLIGLSRARSVRRMAMGALTGKSVTLACYEDDAMSRWVRSVCVTHDIRRGLAFSGGVAPMLEAITAPDSVRVVDFVDVDSSKWADYATKRSWPIGSLFAKEGRALFEAERRLARAADVSVFVSRREAALFASLAPDLAEGVTFVDNGVDTEYFSPQRRGADPFEGHDRTIVFTGAMDYWPNVEAVTRFHTEVMPELLRMDDRWRFYVVGSNPVRSVRALAGSHATRVTGRVEDIRPWLGHASAAVAPMSVARGVQNKVLEAMAMERPVVASTLALEGIEAAPGREVAVADSVADYVRELTAIGGGTQSVDGTAARAYVHASHSWPTSVERLSGLLERVVA